jgi:putative transposase
MMQHVETLAGEVGVQTACEALAVPRSSLYAWRCPKPAPTPRPATPPANALSAEEKTAVLAELNSERFADQTPYEVYPQLLDEGRYLCSLRGMYRILAENQAVGDRRNQLRHPARPAPQVIASRPNQAWVWDITRLLSVLKYQCFYLYLVLDLFSRFILGWLIADKQSGDYAEQLLAASFKRFQLEPGQLTVHSDNGGPMTAKPIEWLFSDLGIRPSLSRPHVSNDNPHAEAGFKTLKYHPTYPDRFDSLIHAQSWMRDFERWYCWEHHHTALGLMTPAAIHFGQAEALWLKRQAVLQAAYQAHPERFSRGLPVPPRWPDQVGINVPKTIPISGECLSNDTKLLLTVSKTP